MIMKCWSKIAGQMPFSSNEVATVVDILFKETVEGNNVLTKMGMSKRGRNDPFSKRKNSAMNNKTAILLEQKRKELVAS